MEAGPSPSGFDATAERYDADERGNRVIAHMRERAFVHMREAFPPGARLVELGSGTGTEAARLASELGCSIALVDPATRLLERASEKVRASRRGSLLGAHPIPARSVGDLERSYGAGSFDGAYSSFGPLNCEPSLRPVAEGLARLLRADAPVVISIINRWCVTEPLWFALRGPRREAVRRWGGAVQAAAFPGGPRDVTTYYYSAADLAVAFAPAFRVEHVEALPLLWPPPYLDFVVARSERLFRALEPLERWAARQPGLRQLGDHTLLVLRRASRPGLR